MDVDEDTAPETGRPAPLPADEAERLAELRELDILDTDPEQAYDDLTRLASEICQRPIALISLVDEERQWFKSKVGLDVDETARGLAFCAHAILEPDELMEVPDATADERFANNPLVTKDPAIRYYAGAPLTTAAGHALGTLCVIDDKPGEITQDQREALMALSRQVVAQLELRRAVAKLEQRLDEQHRYERQLEEYQRKLEEGVARVTEASVTDSLTGLKNRRGFFESLNQEFGRSRRYGPPLSLALIDIDAFKVYNDTFGHPAADGALAKVADLIEEAVRTFDAVARYGGDEFAVVFPDTDTEGAFIVTERCRRIIEEATWQERPVTVSAGVATRVPDMADGDALIRAADEALYRAKDLGRNRVDVAPD